MNNVGTARAWHVIRADWKSIGMPIYHDEVEIEDFEYDEDEEMYYYPCPCGDQFQISKADLINGEEDATCPSCSLVIKVIYDKEKFLIAQEEVPEKDAEKTETRMQKA